MGLDRCTFFDFLERERPRDRSFLFLERLRIREDINVVCRGSFGVFFCGFRLSENQIVTDSSENEGMTTQNNGVPWVQT